MRRFSKILALVTVALLTAMLIALPITAVEPVYEVSNAYKMSPYYTALQGVTLSGDGRYDVLAVAFSQEGYHEGDSEADMGGGNTNGSKNFVEYNRMYGKLDNGEGNGVSYGYEWCAAFVSWCLRQAGVSEEIAVTEVSCRRMVSWYRERGGFYARESGYVPNPGDLIMFHTGDGVPSHVGIVIGVDHNRVHIIDGNGKEQMVTTHVYHKSSSKILGYCAPDYSMKPGTEFDFPMEPAVSGGTVVAVSSGVIAVIVCIGAVLVRALIRAEKKDLVTLKSLMKGKDE